MQYAKDMGVEKNTPLSHNTGQVHMAGFLGTFNTALWQNPRLKLCPFKYKS